MPGGETTHSSEEHSRLFGFDPQKGLPSAADFRERIHPEDRAELDEMLQRATRERTEFDRTFRVLLPQGVVRYIHGVGHPVVDASGELVEMVGTSLDVTNAGSGRTSATDCWRASGRPSPKRWLRSSGSGTWSTRSRGSSGKRTCRACSSRSSASKRSAS